MAACSAWSMIFLALHSLSLLVCSAFPVPARPSTASPVLLLSVALDSG
jgi:hypothetical protein